MTQEEKTILFKDLCGRLHYGVYGIITYNGDKEIFSLNGITNVLLLSDNECCNVEDFKPFLRPMSSMTEEEKEEYESTCPDYYRELETYDWLNEHHFDYRGLIEKGLALEATEGMYKKS